MTTMIFRKRSEIVCEKPTNLNLKDYRVLEFKEKGIRYPEIESKTKQTHIEKCTEKYRAKKKEVSDKNHKQQVSLIRKNTELAKIYEDELKVKEPHAYKLAQNKKSSELKNTLKGYKAGKKIENKDLEDSYNLWTASDRPAPKEKSKKKEKADARKQKQYLKRLASKNLSLKEA